jgi:hypothetical protein
MKVFVYTDDPRSLTCMLRRYPDDFPSEIFDAISPTMDYAYSETVETVRGEQVKFITLTPPMTPITREQLDRLLADPDSIIPGCMAIMNVGQMVWL